MNEDKTILHLCADMGSDSKPYVEAGYNVIKVGSDIGIENYAYPKKVYGIIANPPCTHFSIARTNAKTPRDLREGMRLVIECLKIIWLYQYEDQGNKRTMPLKFWCLENPATGLLSWFLGKPVFTYSQQEYNGHLSKRTALWGHFNLPKRPLLYNPLPPRHTIGHIEGTKHDMQTRSITPYDFAKCFYEANP